MLTESELIELEALVDEQGFKDARESLDKFVTYTMPEFDMSWFHQTYYDILDKFARGEIKRLIVSVPPQHGKSEGSSRRLPAYMLGKNPNLKIALASYNETFASDFNRDIQRIIDTEEYSKVFPDTYLNESNVVTVSGSWLRNSSVFEIVGHKGKFKSVGVGGGLTGQKVDIMIMDDLYKDYEAAVSPTISERVWNWYLTVVRKRMRNSSQELIVFTRWDENDLVGRLEQQGKVITLDETKSLDEVLENIKFDEFLKINFPALKVGGPNDLDPREEGEPLWEIEHSKEKLVAERELDPQKFEALNQGNPRSKEGLMYGDFGEYTELPPMKIIKSYTDTADEGKDYLCSIVYGVPQRGDFLYVLDVVFNQKAMEITEPQVAEMLERNDARENKIESNNGGRGFARQVDKLTNNRINVKWFCQSKNKSGRIFVNSASVTRTIIMPVGWKTRWPNFYASLSNHKKDAKNKHDDAADCITGVYETEYVKPKKAGITTY